MERCARRDWEIVGEETGTSEDGDWASKSRSVSIESLQVMNLYESLNLHQSHLRRLNQSPSFNESPSISIISKHNVLSFLKRLYEFQRL